MAQPPPLAHACAAATPLVSVFSRVPALDLHLMRMDRRLMLSGFHAVFLLILEECDNLPFCINIMAFPCALSIRTPTFPIGFSHIRFIKSKKSRGFTSVICCKYRVESCAWHRRSIPRPISPQVACTVDPPATRTCLRICHLSS